MEKLYFYLEDCDGGFVVDEEYMNETFDNVNQKLICVGTLEEITNYMNWLCNDNN